MSTSPESPRPLLSPQLLVLCGAFFFLFLGPGALQQFLMQALGERTGASETGAAVVLALVYLSGPLWLTVYGFCLQALREKWAIVLSGLTYTLFALAVGLGVPYAGMLLVAIVWGWGAETMWATGPARVLASTEQTRYGSTAGFFQSATYSGQMIGVVLLGWVLQRFSSDTMLALAVLLGLAGNVISLGLSTRSARQEPPQLRDALASLRHSKGRLIVLLAMANYFGWGLILSAFGTLMRDLGGLDKLHWAVLPYYAGRLIAAWTAGRVSDALGRERVMAAGFVLSAAALGVAAGVPSAAVVAVLALVLGAQAANVAVVSTALVGDVIPEEERPVVFAGINAFSYIATGAVIVLSQLLRYQFGNFTLCFALFAAVYLACAVVTWRAGRPGLLRAD